MQKPGLELLAVEQLKKINDVSEVTFILEEKYELDAGDIERIIFDVLKFERFAYLLN